MSRRLMYRRERHVTRLLISCFRSLLLDTFLSLLLFFSLSLLPDFFLSFCFSLPPIHILNGSIMEDSASNDPSPSSLQELKLLPSKILNARGYNDYRNIITELREQILLRRVEETLQGMFLLNDWIFSHFFPFFLIFSHFFFPFLIRAIDKVRFQVSNSNNRSIQRSQVSCAGHPSDPGLGWSVFFISHFTRFSRSFLLSDDEGKQCNRV